MSEILINNIAIKHWIRFDYDTSQAILFDYPHFIFRIEDSIVYKALVSDDFFEYSRLIETTNQTEHSVGAFKKLRDTFDVSMLEQPHHQIKLYWHQQLQKYIIKDGCHRISLIKFFNLDNEGCLPRKWFFIEGETR